MRDYNKKIFLINWNQSGCFFTDFESLNPNSLTVLFTFDFLNNREKWWKLCEN